MAGEWCFFADPEGGGGICEIGSWYLSKRVAEVLVGSEEFGVGLKVHRSIPAWKEHERSFGVSRSNC